MSKHVSFIQAVRNAANNNWGQSYESNAAAEKALIEKRADVTAFAGLDMIRRLNVICDALARDARCTEQDANQSSNKRPVNAVKLMVSPGDRLFGFSMDEGGLCEAIVVGFDAEQFPLIVYVCDEYPQYSSPIHWCCTHDAWAPSDIEAVRRGILREEQYHRPRIDFIEAAKKAIEAGDISTVRNGYEE